MKTLIYEITDHDVMKTFFGEDPRFKPVIDIAKDHADLVFEGDLTPVVDCGDILGIDTDEKIGEINDEPVYKQDEYVVVLRYYHADTDSLTLLVHPRHAVEVQLS